MPLSKPKGSGKGSDPKRNNTAPRYTSGSSTSAWADHDHNSWTAQKCGWHDWDDVSKNKRLCNGKQRGNDKQWGNDDHWGKGTTPPTTRDHKMPKGTYADADADFDGAYPGVTLDIDKASTTCFVCKKSFTFWGCVALMKAPGFDTFFRFEDKIASQVAQGIKNNGFDKIPFRNMGKDADGKPIKVAQVCYMCAGQKQHDNMNYLLCAEATRWVMQALQ